jgi:hypothetical protein
MLVFTSCATTQTAFTPITLTETATVIGTKNDVYVKANLWLVDVFNSAKSVIQFSDKDAGVIKGKYVLYFKPSGQYVGELERDAIITLNASENQLTITVTCNERPMGIFYSGTQMDADLNGLIEKFKSEFWKTKIGKLNN